MQPSVQNLAGSRAEPLSLHEEEPAGREMLRERAQAWDWSYSFKKNHPKIQPIPKISPCLKKYMRGSRKLHGGMRGGELSGQFACGAWPRRWRRRRFGLCASPVQRRAPLAVPLALLQSGEG